MEDMFIEEFAKNSIRQAKKDQDSENSVITRARGLGVERAMLKLLIYMEEHKRTPYPGFCRQPEKCKGLSSCPCDPCCID